MKWIGCVPAKKTLKAGVETASPFSEAGPFNEMVVMGVMAVRLQGLNKELQWNGEKMTFTNITASEKIKICTKDAFAIHDGHPTFTREYTKDMDVSTFANELIKHTYRTPWTLPEMPA